MNSKTIRNSLLLILTALIWGTAFVAQRSGGDAIGPYAFNCLRSFIGSLFLVGVIKVISMIGLDTRKPETKEDKKLLITGGISCGIILCLASNFQQLGMYYGTTAGKSGFLTACYILLVPIFGIFLHRKCGWNIWIGVVLSVCGLYLLCMHGSISFQFSDILVLICAILFAIHILVIDHFSPLVDGVRMSCIQFFVCGVITAIPMFFVDMNHSLSGVTSTFNLIFTNQAYIALFYAGIMSCGVAYTLQIIAQNGLNPTVASLIMSLESVFSVIAGWLILKESMGARELLGCLLIFTAIILAQIPVKSNKQVSSSSINDK